MKYISFLVSPRTVFWVIVIEVIIWSNIDLINSRLLARMCTILKWAWFLLPTLYQIICVQESLGLIFQKKQEFYICTFYGLTESSSKISGKHHKTFSTSRASSHSFFWILPTRVPLVVGTHALTSIQSSSLFLTFLIGAHPDRTKPSENTSASSTAMGWG